MRILNRPMFKYGGPIREGIMDGMRNNYQSGQLVRPGPGRPGYQGIPKTKLGIAGWLGKKIPFLKQPITKISTGTKDIIPRTLQKIKSIFGSTTPATGELYKTPFKPSSFKLNPVSKYFVTSPEGRLLKSMYEGKGLVTKPLKWAATQAVKSPIIVGGLIWTGVNWVRKDGSPANEKEIAEAKNLAGTGDKWDPGAGGEQIITQSMKDKIAKDAQNKRLKSYLDMMGYDRSKRTALGDALIDASAIVQEGTTEAGSLKEADWGKMINKAIQTTSKRLDKPEQIREAVGLMMTKGAIEKDITAEEDALKKIATKLQIKGLQKSLAGDTFKEVIAKKITAASGTAPIGKELATILRITEGIDAKVIPSSELKQGQDEIEFMTGEIAKAKETGTPVPPGHYVISGRVLIVDETGKITPYL